MEITFQNELVFITGASRGIGQAIADSFRAASAKVLAPGRDILDLSSQESVSAYLSALSSVSPDIIILNAGMNVKGTLEEIHTDAFLDTFQVNVFSSVQILKHFVTDMKKKKKGKIIFISSLYSFVSREARASYASSKNAITGLVKTLALELAPFHICVNAVAPGFVLTDMTRRNLSEKERDEMAAMIPSRRFQTESEIAHAVMFLASSYNQSITGHILPVDGGFLCR